jgi:hypothetical protein
MNVCFNHYLIECVFDGRFGIQITCSPSGDTNISGNSVGLRDKKSSELFVRATERLWEAGGGRDGVGGRDVEGMESRDEPKSRSWGITEIGLLGRETGVESRGLGGWEGGMRKPEI